MNSCCWRPLRVGCLAMAALGHCSYTTALENRVHCSCVIGEARKDAACETTQPGRGHGSGLLPRCLRVCRVTGAAACHSVPHAARGVHSLQESHNRKILCSNWGVPIFQWRKAMLTEEDGFPKQGAGGSAPVFADQDAPLPQLL